MFDCMVFLHKYRVFLQLHSISECSIDGNDCRVLNILKLLGVGNIYLVVLSQLLCEETIR